MGLEDNLQFDEEGNHYIVDYDLGADGEESTYKFISAAYINKEGVEGRTLSIELVDYWLGEFKSETITDEMDEHLKKIKGIEDVHWSDSEFFEMTFKENQASVSKLVELVKNLDKKLTKLSKIEE